MKPNDSILVGDIGGTNTRLALAHLNDGKFRVEGYEKFRGDDYSAFDDIITTYLSHKDTQPTAASLAIAGPIHDGEVKLTNRDWHLSDKALGQQFGFQTVKMHNDFAAMSRSVLIMNADSFETFYEAQNSDPLAPIVVAGPGTGFGMGIVLPDCDPPHVLPSEGGHQAYAPHTHAECEVLKYLNRKHDFISLELVCSGSGMDAVHEAISALHDQPYRKLPPAVIRERAEAGDAVCQDVCEIRAAAVMGAVGDMALATGALGGVVLAGGVSGRLSDYLRAPIAMERFFNRGPRSEYMKQISIRLLTHPEAPLYGAAALYKDHA